MGGVEYDEPPSKRVKVSSGNSGAISNGVCFRELGVCSLSHSMAQPSSFLGSEVLIKKDEFVRVMAQALYSFGYSKTGACLEEESGIQLHSPVIGLFIRQILEGQWDESISLLHKLDLKDETIIKLASFVILEQKFFELLDKENIIDALKTLRTEISPLCIRDKTIRELSSFILSSSRNLLDGMYGKELILKSRKKLLNELSNLLPTLIIPQNRLVHLVEQALCLQKHACEFHNSSIEEMSLFTNQCCEKDQIPTQTLQILHGHNDEVWFLQFSHNGKYLASSSGDHLVIIWEVMVDGHVSLKYRLLGHQKPVSFAIWSPDDGQLLTCGVEEVVRRWDISSGQCLHIYEKRGLGLISCAWLPDGKNIFLGATDNSISMWDLEGKQLQCWKAPGTIRIADLGVISNTKEVISMCDDHKIILFGWESNLVNLIEESETITSFSLSEDGKFLLLSLWNEELHLWNMDSHPRVVARYRGHKRSRFIVRSCLGGLKHVYIASGSEDSQICIWHRLSCELILKLKGHSGAVNCVSWNPANPYMLASASDDRTIRIWGSKQKQVNNMGGEGD